MQKNENGFVNALLLFTPLLAVALTVLLRMVTFGLQALTEEYWTNTARSVSCLILSFIPVYQFALNKRRATDKVKAKEGAFNVRFGRVIAECKLASLRAFSAADAERMRQEYIAGLLQLAGIPKDEYEAKYKTWTNKEIRKSDLRKYQKKALKKANSNLRFYPVNIDGMYAAHVTGTRRRIALTSRTKQFVDIMKKIMNCVFMGAAMAAIVIKPIEDANVLIIIANIMIDILGMAFNCTMAVVAGFRNIDTVYMEELNAKTIYLDEFFEWDKKQAATSR